MPRILVQLTAVCFGMVAGSILLSGCAATPPAGRRPPGLNFYVQAVEAYNAQDYDRAIILLNEAVRQSPDLRMARG
ncbi:MAG: hypothetical protein NZ561_02645, partial [Phycisphaerae bacterium]|nr:hypothetical protein [Phycisphaerae bacterium]